MNAYLVRLHKYLADKGVASRRKCEEFISRGLVTVNGKVVREQGIKIDPEKDRVEVNDKAVREEKKKYRTIKLYKPRGYVCTTKSSEGKTVYDLIKGVKERVVCIGRLDKKSEGLLLFSNDGDLVYQLSHPSFEQEKIYQVMVSGEVSEVILKKLRSRLIIDGYKIRPADVQVLRPGNIAGRTLLEFRLREGRKRQIRKMCELCGLNVHRLVRVQVKNITLSGLKPGEWADLTQKELMGIKGPS